MDLPTDWFVAWPASRARERLDEQVRERVPALSRRRDAKSKPIEQSARHTITRRYLAITRGVPVPPAGTFRSRLASDARRLQRISRDGELAVTHYEVAEDLGEIALVVVML